MAHTGHQLFFGLNFSTVLKKHNSQFNVKKSKTRLEFNRRNPSGKFPKTQRQICRVHQCLTLRAQDSLKYGDVHENFNFLKTEDLRPLNTCQKHFELAILPNFAQDE